MAEPMSAVRPGPLAAVLTLLAAGTAFAEPPELERASQILVDLRDDTDDADEAAIEEKLGGIDLRLNSVHAADERFFVAEVDPEELDALVARIADDPRVEHVEPNHVYRASFVPDDPLFERQWSFRLVGAPAAWDLGRGEGVTVAVIDTGVAYEDHGPYRRVEDLADTRFAKGYDFVDDDEHPNDDHGHGTHVAGTIAQSTDNGRGVAGLAPGATIMPIKVLDRSGRGSAADIADAIRYAADEGAQVINLSLGGGLRSLVMQAAVRYARSKGVIVVCAAGNGGRKKVEFPAAYPGAFAVSSVGPNRQLAPYSSWGKQIAIAAPGGDKTQGGDAGAILQNTIQPGAVGVTDRYLAFQGTSMAAPHVAGAAALVIGAGVTNPDLVETILRETAADVGAPGADEKYGAGVLDAGKATVAATAAGRGLRYLIPALAFLMWLIRRLRRRGVELALRAAAVLGAVLGSSGLWFLSDLGLAQVPGLGLLALPVASWDLGVLGAGTFRTALWASALPFFALATATLGVRRLQGFLVGLGVGWACHLAVAALLMPADVLLVPGLAGGLDRLWLVLNAGLIGGLTVLLTRR